MHQFYKYTLSNDIELHFWLDKTHIFWGRNVFPLPKEETF